MINKKDLEDESSIKIEDLPRIENYKDISYFIVLDNAQQTALIKREDVLYDIKELYTKEDVDKKLSLYVNINSNELTFNDVWDLGKFRIRSLPAEDHSDLLTKGQAEDYLNSKAIYVRPNFGKYFYPENDNLVTLGQLRRAAIPLTGKGFYTTGNFIFGNPRIEYTADFGGGGKNAHFTKDQLRGIQVLTPMSQEEGINFVNSGLLEEFGINIEQFPSGYLKIGEKIFHQEHMSELGIHEFTPSQIHVSDKANAALKDEGSVFVVKVGEKAIALISMRYKYYQGLLDPRILVTMDFHYKLSKSSDPNKKRILCMLPTYSAIYDFTHIGKPPDFGKYFTVRNPVVDFIAGKTGRREIPKVLNCTSYIERTDDGKITIKPAHENADFYKEELATISGMFSEVFFCYELCEQTEKAKMAYDVGTELLYVSIVGENSSWAIPPGASLVKIHLNYLDELFIVNKYPSATDEVSGPGAKEAQDFWWNTRGIPGVIDKHSVIQRVDRKSDLYLRSYYTVNMYFPDSAGPFPNEWFNGTRLIVGNFIMDDNSYIDVHNKVDHVNQHLRIFYIFRIIT